MAPGPTAPTIIATVELRARRVGNTAVSGTNEALPSELAPLGRQVFHEKAHR